MANGAPFTVRGIWRITKRPSLSDRTVSKRKQDERKAGKKEACRLEGLLPPPKHFNPAENKGTFFLASSPWSPSELILPYSHSGMQKIKRRRRGSESPFFFFSPCCEQMFPSSSYLSRVSSCRWPGAWSSFWLTFLQRSKYSPLCAINEIKHLFIEIIHATTERSSLGSFFIEFGINGHPKMIKPGGVK